MGPVFGPSVWAPENPDNARTHSPRQDVMRDKPTLVQVWGLRQKLLTF